MIVDSGSTKTDWALLSANRLLCRIQTSGINPSLMSNERIEQILTKELLPALLDSGEYSSQETLTEIMFYGAGCRPEQQERMSSLLSKPLSAQTINIASDLLGAAHALCARQAGIVCILGTGSGSALYDGEKFIHSTPSLGYILGDEGSGGSLGKHLLADVFKGLLPVHLCQDFLATYSIDLAALIQHVYREPSPNRYLAQFTPFLVRHRHEESIHDFLINEFRAFFQRNIRSYKRPDLAVNFVGSIATFFADELSEAAQIEGFQIGHIVRSPLDNLIEQALAENT